MGTVGRRQSNRLGVGLAVGALACCCAASIVIGRVPMMVGHRSPFFGEVLSMSAVPLISSGVGIWASVRRRLGQLVAATAVLGIFSLVTGFSIGGYFLPSFGFLLWSVIVLIDSR